MTARAPVYLPVSAATPVGQAAATICSAWKDEAAIGQIDCREPPDLIVCAGQARIFGPYGRRSCRRYGDDRVAARLDKTCAAGPGR